MTIEDRVARRFKAALTEEKMKALLLKLRKGADSSVSMKQLIEALNYLGGWKVEQAVGLVQMHGYLGAEKDKPSFEVEENADHVQRLYEQIKKDEVRSFPSNPKPGQRYTMEVTEPAPFGKGWKDEERTGFYYKEWRGAACIRFTSPEGKVFEALPNKFDLARYANPMKMPIWDVKKWLRGETKFLEQVSNNLGMPTYEDERREKTAPRTRDNTGTCPCCFRNIKLKARSGNKHPIMVLHGYQRPGWGSVHGQCIGVDFPPFELSPEGTKHLVKMLHQSLDGEEKWLHRLKSGDVTQLTVQRGAFGKPETLTPETEGPRKWAELIKSRISQSESMVRALKSDISKLEQLISSWKEQPLPTEGEKAKPPPAFLR